SFVVGLPLGVSLLVLTLLLKGPVTVLLGARARWVILHSIERFYAQPLHWPIALLSIFVGTWTHIAWDSMTHQGGWIAQRLPALPAPVSVLGWHTEVSRLLQYASSVLGLVILAFWVRGLLKRAPSAVAADPSWKGAHWLLLAAILLVSLSIGVERSAWAYSLGFY